MIIDNPTISGSALLSGSLTITGSLNVSGSISGLASNAVSASYALNATSASYALNATTSSYALIATSASYALASTSASYSNNATSASYSNDATSASYALNATSASYALASTSASYSNNSTSASYAANSDLLDGRDSLTFANTGSNAFIGTQNINGAVAITGSLTTTGAITAQTLNVQQVTSSIVYSSGSNIFGNNISDTQSMTGSVGISGSLAVVGAGTITGVLTLNSTITNGTYTYTLPSATGTLALTSNITSAISGTTNYLPKFSAASTINDSVIQQSSTLIGINVSPSRVLHLSSSGSNSAIRLDNTVSGRPFLLTFDDSQNLTFINSSDSGIIAFNTGTGTSTTKFSIANGGAATFSSTVQATQYTATSTGGSGLRVYGSAGTNQWDIYLNSTNLRFSDNTGTGSIVFDRPLSGTSASFSGILQVKSTSSSPSIWAGAYGGGITILADNATSNRYLDLSIVDSAGAIAAQGIRITTGGNVGIGTTSPDVTGFGWKVLTIKGGTASGEAGVLELQSPATTGAANLGIIAFLDGSTRGGQIYVQRDSSTTTSNMLFATNGGSGITERMRITAGGNVEIKSAGKLIAYRSDNTLL